MSLGPITLCPGFATYSVNDDTSITVNGQNIAFDAGTVPAKKVTSLWSKFADAIQQASAKTGIPISWLVGIMTIESGGNPNACSPCINYDSAGNQVCSFAPNCGGPCCAYGLMQFIDSTARAYGTTGPALLGDERLAIEIAGKYLRTLLDKSGGDPVVMAKRYNGGGPSCSGAGTFGIGGQGDYPANFVRAINTFLRDHPEAMQGTGGIPTVATISGRGIAFVVGMTVAYLGYETLNRIAKRF